MHEKQEAINSGGVTFA